MTTSAKQFAIKVIDVLNLKKRLKAIDLISASQELIEKYSIAKDYLDSNYLHEILLADDLGLIESRLWELIILNKLLSHPMVTVEPHRDNGPDWLLKLKNTNVCYYIEATCSQIPKKKTNSEIHRVIEEFTSKGKSVSGNALIAETKSRISTRIDEKIKKHENFVRKKDVGYILALSYGGIPFFAGCDMYTAIQTIYPFGNLNIEFVPNTSGEIAIQERWLKYMPQYPKPSNNALIDTNIFGCDKYNWVSAILFSEVEPYLLLTAAEKLPEIAWGKVKNDFVLIHNPFAAHPLSSDLFESKTIIRIDRNKNKMIVEGHNIFPSF